MFDHMFHLPLPILEKVLRPIIVYICLVIFLRVFGKRELAQLNPLDLVVLLSLSNTVQNAMIGDDNSVSGGLIGAFSLLAINWLVVRMLLKSPKLETLFEGTERVLIEDGRVDYKALKAELLSEQELLSAVHKQGFDEFQDVAKCVLEPNGTFYIEGRKPSDDELQQTAVMKKMEEIAAELQAIKEQLALRG